MVFYIIDRKKKIIHYYFSQYRGKGVGFKASLAILKDNVKNRKISRIYIYRNFKIFLRSMSMMENYTAYFLRIKEI